MKLELKVSHWFDRHIMKSEWIGTPLSWMWEIPLGLTILLLEVIIEGIGKGIKSVWGITKNE